ncbi:MAG: hypothetical protein JW982_11500 [Spirochaetes bacterium]|nr:hypothetical protein [Spirochaetota bacterium]
MKISKLTITIIFLTAVFLQSCQTPEKKAINNDLDRDALQMLNESRFEEAYDLSSRSLLRNNNNSQALAVNVISAYVLALLQFRKDVDSLKQSNPISMISEINRIFENADKNLKQIKNNLNILELDKNFKFRFTPGNLKIDLNGNGMIDPKEEVLTAIVKDRDGNDIDPRRPEFAFDHSDVLWAQSYISLHLAYISILSSVDYANFMFFVTGFNSGERKNEITLKIKSRESLIDGYNYLNQMLDYSDQTRISVLAETDDEFEWLPNLSQKSCPLPMQMSQKIFNNWEVYTGLIRDLLEGKTVLNFNGLSSGKGNAEDLKAEGGINIKRLFTEPKDAVLNIEQIKLKAAAVDSDKNLDPFLEEVFGTCYEYNKIPSPIVRKLVEMNRETDKNGAASANRIKYFLWII